MIQDAAHLNETLMNKSWKFKHFLSSRTMWKVSFKTLSWYFSLKMNAELAENAPVYRFAINKEILNFKATLLFRLALGKDFFYFLFVFKLRAISSFWSIYSILGTEKTQFTCIVDHDWRESRLQSLAIVMLCLVRVGVTWVSWTVRYLDKPWQTIVPYIQNKHGEYLWNKMKNTKKINKKNQL